LLEEAVKMVQQKGGDGLAFAENNVCEYLIPPPFGVSLI
jgi:hypothetical protein